MVSDFDLGSAHLVGNSYGADIILRLEVEHPEMVRTLVLAEPGLISWPATMPGGAAMYAKMASRLRAMY